MNLTCQEQALSWLLWFGSNHCPNLTEFDNYAYDALGLPEELASDI